MRNCQGSQANKCQREVGQPAYQVVAVIVLRNLHAAGQRRAEVLCAGYKGLPTV